MSVLDEKWEVTEDGSGERKWFFITHESQRDKDQYIFSDSDEALIDHIVALHNADLERKRHAATTAKMQAGLPNCPDGRVCHTPSECSVNARCWFS